MRAVAGTEHGALAGAPDEAPKAPFFRIGLFLLASSFFIACIVSFFHSYFGTLSTDLIGPPEDNLQDFWATWYSQVALDTNPAGFFETRLVKFPEGTTLHYQSFCYTSLALISIVRKLFGLPISLPVLVGLHNGALLVTFYLAGMGAFYLTRRYTSNSVTALLGGFLFAFSPMHVEQTLHHMHVASIQFIPFFALCFLAAVETGRVRYLAGSIVFHALSALSSWYYLFYILFFLGFYYVYRAIEERRLVPDRLLAIILSHVAGVVLILSPIIVPMLLHEVHGAPVYAVGHNWYVADLLGWLTFSPHHLLSGLTGAVRAHFAGNPWEATAYLGLVNIGLFVWAFANRGRLKLTQMTFLFWGMILFILFSSGLQLRVYGERTIPLPTGITRYISLVRNVRTPSRAMVFVYLFLGIGVGLAVTSLIERYRRQRRVLIPALSLLFGLEFLDYYPVKLESTKVECPPEYGVISLDSEAEFGILDLPKGYLPGNSYMFNQVCHHRPIVVATLTRDLSKSLIDRLTSFDTDETKTLLRQSRVKYIVLHWNAGTGEHATFERDALAAAQAYPTVYSSKVATVLRVY